MTASRKSVSPLLFWFSGNFKLRKTSSTTLRSPTANEGTREETKVTLQIREQMYLNHFLKHIQADRIIHLHSSIEADETFQVQLLWGCFLFYFCKSV